MMVSESILEEATQRLVSRFHPDKIILFGSQARGTAHPRSDVDLLVVCQFEGKRRGLMVEMDRELRYLEMASDISILTPKEYDLDRQLVGSLARPASLEGRILYERT
jgi:uncharacterized protein